MSELKPCPFCGSPASYMEFIVEDAISCQQCKAEMIGHKKSELIKQWNRRNPIQWPTEEEVKKEVWSRIHRHESPKDDFELPQKIIREITAEAYWSACYRWLRDFIEKGQGE